MSPQESDEDKSDYNLVVDEVSRGPTSSHSDLRTRRSGHRAGSGLSGELGDPEGVGVLVFPSLWDGWDGDGMGPGEVGETGAPQADLLSIAQVGKLRPREPWMWATEAASSPGSWSHFGGVTPPSPASLFPICSMGENKTKPIYSPCYLCLCHLTHFTDESTEAQGVFIILPRWVLSAQSRGWRGTRAGYREGLSFPCHFTPPPPHHHLQPRTNPPSPPAQQPPHVERHPSASLPVGTWWTVQPPWPPALAHRSPEPRSSSW